MSPARQMSTDWRLWEIVRWYSTIHWWDSARPRTATAPAGVLGDTARRTND